MQNLKAAFFFFLALCISSCTFAQQAVVACDAMNVVYVFFENPITIVVPGVKSENLIVKATGGILTGDSGHYYLKPYDEINTKEAVLKIFYKSGVDTLSAGEKVLRIIRVPKPVEYHFGMKESGNISKAELAIQKTVQIKRMYFPYRDFKYVVQRFDISLFSPGLHLTHTNIGQSVDKVSSGIIQHAKPGDLIVINRVYSNAMQTGFIDKDMWYPFVFAIDHGYNGWEGHEDDPIYLTAMDDQSPQTQIQWNSLYKSDNGNYRDSGAFSFCAKDSVWTITIEKDSYNYLYSKDYYHLDTLLKTEMYSSKGYLSSLIDYSNYSFKSFYPKGNLKASGIFDDSSGCELEERKKPESLRGAYHDSIQDFFFKDSFDMPLMPTGEWKFYYSNGQLQAKGSFKGIVKYRDYGECVTNIYYKVSPPDLIVRDGLWQFYNQKGKLLREIKYEQGKGVMIKKYE